MHRIANVAIVSVRDVKGVLEGYVCCGMDGDWVYPALLRKRFETFLSQAPWQTYSGYHNGYKDDVKHFQVYTGYEIQDNSGTKSKKQADSSRSGIHSLASYVEIKNKEEIERFSKESKDGDKFCNDVVEVKEKFSNRIVQHKDDSSPNSIAEINIYELEKESRENICDNEKCKLQITIVKLEKVLSQQTKDFDDVKLELSKRTAKFEAYFEKLKNTKVVLERKLSRKVDDSKAEKDQFLKEINHLSIQLKNLKGKSVETKFDKPLILGKPPAGKLLITSQHSKSWFTPKVVVQKDLSKLVTTQSLPKNEKYQLLKRIASLESKLTSHNLRSCQKNTLS
ncbi:hypothetical protein Tco_0242735 [Tanacetum coccineum]